MSTASISSAWAKGKVASGPEPLKNGLASRWGSTGRVGWGRKTACTGKPPAAADRGCCPPSIRRGRRGRRVRMARNARRTRRNSDDGGEK